MCGSGGLRGDEADEVEQVKHVTELLHGPGGLEQFWAIIGWVGEERVSLGLSHNDPEALACFNEARPRWRPDALPTSPALVYWGADEDVPAETTDMLDALGIEHHEVSDADHVTAFEQTTEVLSFVEPFLDPDRDHQSNRDITLGQNLPVGTRPALRNGHGVREGQLRTRSGYSQPTPSLSLSNP